MRTKYRGGFSLVDLVIAIAISAILIGLMLPALQQTREASRRNQCSDNLRIQSAGLIEYHSDFGRFPPALVVSNNTNPDFFRERSRVRGNWWSWAYRIAPRIGFQDFFDSVNPAETPWWTYYEEGEPNAGLSLIGTKTKLFQCPTDPEFPVENWVDPTNPNNQAAITSYLAVNGRNAFVEFGGQDGTIYVNSSVSVDEITDGTSNTLVIGERPSRGLAGWLWADFGGGPTGAIGFGTPGVVLGVHEILSAVSSEFYRPPGSDITFDRFHFFSFHEGGAFWAFADGSTRFLTYDVDSPINETTEPGTPPTVLAQLASRAGDDP